MRKSGARPNVLTVPLNDLYLDRTSVPATDCTASKDARDSNVPLEPPAVEAGSAPDYDETMEKVVNIARSHKEADEWDVRQQVAMSPQERIRASRELRRRAYPPPNKDVRECHDKQ